MITTVGVFSTQTDAELGLRELKTFGVQDEDVLTIAGESVSRGFVEKLIGFGIGEKDATRFQEYIRSGDVLVIVRVKSLGHKEILIRAHAREVQEYTK